MFDEAYILQWEEFMISYENFRLAVLNGSKGMTAQFWIIYINFMRMQSMAHTAIQQNDLEMYIHAWKSFLPFYFILNKTNYARYGSYYVHIMENMDTIYPGLRELIKDEGISVQAQNRHHIRTAIDQRGEQGINRDAKTTGGIKYFAGNSSSVLKWCLNRPNQAENTNALKQLSGLNSSTDSYKPLRPSRILKSEKQVSDVLHVLEEEYLNPFDLEIDQTHLYNLSSGVHVQDEWAKEIVSLKQKGEELCEQFKRERLTTSGKSFNGSTIPKNKIKLIQNTGKVVKINKNNKTKVLEVNRNIIGS